MRFVNAARHACGAVLFVCLFSTTAWAVDDITVPAEYSKTIQSKGAIEPLAKDIFGEQVGLYSGSLEFVQTDVSLPGNNALEVMVGRRFVPNQPTLPTVGASRGQFADWDLEIPHLEGVFAGIGWVVPTYGGQRCSHFSYPPNAPSTDGAAMFSAGEYWQGHFFVMPGRGKSEMLYRNYSIPAPSDGYTYPVTSKDGTMFRCIPLDTGVSGQEGFEAVLPDGTRIKFDHLTSRAHSNLKKSNGDAEVFAAPMGVKRRAWMPRWGAQRVAARPRWRRPSTS